MPELSRNCPNLSPPPKKKTMSLFRLFRKYFIRASTFGPVQCLPSTTTRVGVCLYQEEKLVSRRKTCEVGAPPRRPENTNNMKVTKNSGRTPRTQNTTRSKTGARIPISWKRGFRGPKPPFPVALTELEKGVFGPKIPTFHVFPCRKKRGCFDRKLPFPQQGENFKWGFWGFGPLSGVGGIPIRVVTSLSHCELLSRCTLCRHRFPRFYIRLPSQGSRRSQHRGRSI